LICQALFGESKNVKERFATSGGAHTLRCHDLGMILAWHRDGVSDGGHSADVMKKDGWSRARVAEGRALELFCGDTSSMSEGVKDLDRTENSNSSQKKA